MISKAADYRFVDFESGDMPTDKFDGNVMPKRDAFGASGFVEGALKAEDIAFLYEAAARAPIEWAQYGASEKIYLEYFLENKLVPTKKLTANQFNLVVDNIRSMVRQRLYDGLSYTIHRFSSNVGLLSERTFFGDDMFSVILPYLDRRVVDDSYNVKRGDALSLNKIKSLFSIVEKLAHPVISLMASQGSFNGNDFVQIYEAGTKVPPAQQPATSNLWFVCQRNTISWDVVRFFIASNFKVVISKKNITSIKNVQFITHGWCYSGGKNVVDIRTVSPTIADTGSSFTLTFSITELYKVAIRILNFMGVGANPSPADVTDAGLIGMYSAVLIRCENDDIKFA